MLRTQIPKIVYGEREIGGPRHLYRQGLVIRFINEAIPSGKILDAGCGDGSLTTKLAIQGFRVYAIEAANGFVRMVEDKIKILHLEKNVNVKIGDILNTEFPSNFFDGIVCGEVLEHTDDIKVLNEFRRILKKGGILVITVPSKNKGWDIWDDMSGHLRLYTKRGLTNLLQKCGFRIEKMRFWGFPIMKLYHRLVFLTWVRLTQSKRLDRTKMHLTTKIGMNKLLSFIVALVFKLDEIFSCFPLGIGIIVRARKI